jgi:hypothetical protein
MLRRQYRLHGMVATAVELAAGLEALKDDDLAHLLLDMERAKEVGVG